MDFKKFKTAVAEQFAKMQDSLLYKTDVSGDTLWDVYLNSFPAGTNGIYRERRKYDCNACKQFIRTMGNVVAIRDNKLVSIWDIEVDEPAFQIVADAMSALVKSAGIRNVFLSAECSIGLDRNFKEMAGGEVTTYKHFFVNIPKRHVVRFGDIGTELAEFRAAHDVLLRGLTEITSNAVDTVLELMAQGSLYRGEEFAGNVSRFKILQREFQRLETINGTERDLFVWRCLSFVSPAVVRIRNTAIGTLLVDLSNDIGLEESVRKYEEVMAPANYKRPTALVSAHMVEGAKKKVEELGLTSALERRYAKQTDISINDILYADRTSKRSLAGDVFDEISAAAADKKPKNLRKVEKIHIEKFLKDVLPSAASLEVMFEGAHIKNLVSLIAPVDPTAGRLFKWPNNFSWTYNGDMADSIRDKVKAAGGNVTGDLCCRLAWYNYDDLDLHMVEPDGNHIYYATNRMGRGRKSACGGLLDVDMNAGYGSTREPVENIFYADKIAMKEGVYYLYVNQFARRESDNVGFEAEIDFMGKVYSFAYEKPVKGNVTVAKFEYKCGEIRIIESLPVSTVSKEVWGITTNKYHKVNLLLLSPNHWESTGSGIGNKHYFFMLDGCVNPDEARGFFNEFLKEDLNEHRKVFEIAGSKMKAAHTPEQLSGLGFSSTIRNEILCRVGGSFNRVLKIMF